MSQILLAPLVRGRRVLPTTLHLLWLFEDQPRIPLISPHSRVVAWHPWSKFRAPKSINAVSPENIDKLILRMEYLFAKSLPWGSAIYLLSVKIFSFEARLRN